MTLIPRPRRPEEPTPPFNFEEWDLNQFKRAGEVLTSIAQQKDAVTSMRQKLLELYFREEGCEQT
jgi:hypothetical protein